MPDPADGLPKLMQSACMNVDASPKNSAEAPPQRIAAGDCNATVSDCCTTASSKCDTLAECRSFKIHVNDQQCSSTARRWALFTLGNESFSRRNDDWVAYAKPPAPPPAPTPPPPPTPPGACASPVDVDCSLNGLCTAGACVRDAPWHGGACELLQRLPAAPGGICGYSLSVNRHPTLQGPVTGPVRECVGAADVGCG
jgi:hypothetical protein